MSAVVNASVEDDADISSHGAMSIPPPPPPVYETTELLWSYQTGASVESIAGGCRTASST